MFDDWHLAMASYNGGPGRMQRAVKRSGIDDFWRLTSTTKYLPRETREYVPMILAAIVIAKNPTRYGFEAPSGPVTRYEHSYEKVSVPRAVDLRRVAEWAGTTHRADSDAQPRAASLDHAAALSELRSEGAGRHGRQAARRGSSTPRPATWRC